MVKAKRTKRNVYTMADHVIKMHNCSIDLDHLGYGSDLDATHTLENIVRHLSPELQGRWAEEAERIGRSDREANFYDLTEYLDRLTNFADSGFG